MSSSGYEPEHQNCYIEYDPGAGHVVLTKSIMNTGSGWDNVQPLVSGSSVNSTSNYWGSLGDANVVDFTGTCHVPIGQDCYIGFKFGKNGNIHYGFARLEVNGNSTTGYTATWKECFYENTPNTPIETGVLASVSSAYRSSLNVYPNPAKGEINIVGINSSSKVEIFNTLGVCVKEVHGYVSGESIDLSNLVKGIYVVRIHHQGKTETKHIVKQ